MDLSHPIRSIVPGLAGPVLEVLAGTTRPLTGREVQRLLSRPASQQGVQDVLDRLAAQGLVDQVTAGNAILNSLNRDHILAGSVTRLAGVRNELRTSLAAIVVDAAPWAVRAILFGSFARGDADDRSDIDLLLVYPDAPDADDGPAHDAVATRIRRLTGNACNVLVYGIAEFEALPNRAPDLHAALDAEGIDLLDSPVP